MTPDWLHIERRDAPLIISIPHAGTELRRDEARFVSPWLARRDADWHLHALYDFAADLGATVVQTSISRSIIDVNRNPDGVSLYPGQATTELCPTTTFDGDPLYRPGEAPRDAEIAERRALYYAPYHEALRSEIARLRQAHGASPLYDAHSIRSRHSAPVRRRAAGFQPRHERRREAARPGCANGSPRPRRERPRPSSSTAASRAAGSPALSAPRDRGRGRAARTRLPRLYGRAGAARPSELAGPDRRRPRRADPRDAARAPRRSPRLDVATRCLTARPRKESR